MKKILMLLSIIGLCFVLNAENALARGGDSFHLDLGLGVPLYLGPPAYYYPPPVYYYPAPPPASYHPEVQLDPGSPPVTFRPGTSCSSVPYTVRDMNGYLITGYICLGVDNRWYLQ